MPWASGASRQRLRCFVIKSCVTLRLRAVRPRAASDGWHHFLVRPRTLFPLPRISYQSRASPCALHLCTLTLFPRPSHFLSRPRLTLRLASLHPHALSTPLAFPIKAAPHLRAGVLTPALRARASY